MSHPVTMHHQGQVSDFPVYWDSGDYLRRATMLGRRMAKSGPLQSILATRNPKVSARVDGTSTSREAERSQAGIAFHAPPRITRVLWNFGMQLSTALPSVGVPW